MGRMSRAVPRAEQQQQRGLRLGDQMGKVSSAAAAAVNKAVRREAAAKANGAVRREGHKHLTHLVAVGRHVPEGAQEPRPETEYHPNASPTYWLLVAVSQVALHTRSVVAVELLAGE